MARPTPDDIRAHSHPDTGADGFWIARVGGRGMPVVVRLWDAGRWVYQPVDDPNDDDTIGAWWESGELMGEVESEGFRGTAEEVIEKLGADAWWRWDGGPVAC